MKGVGQHWPESQEGLRPPGEAGVGMIPKLSGKLKTQGEGSVLVIFLIKEGRKPHPGAHQHVQTSSGQRERTGGWASCPHRVPARTCAESMPRGVFILEASLSGTRYWLSVFDDGKVSL